MCLVKLKKDYTTKQTKQICNKIINTFLLFVSFFNSTMSFFFFFIVWSVDFKSELKSNRKGILSRYHVQIYPHVSKVAL